MTITCAPCGGCRHTGSVYPPRTPDRGTVIAVRKQYAKRGLAAAWLLAASAASVGPATDSGQNLAATPAERAATAGGLLFRTADEVRPSAVDVLAPLLPPAAPLTSAPLLGPVDSGLSVKGIPARALAAYKSASAVKAKEGCRVPWQLVAAIGFVESGHGSFRGAAIGADGRVTPEILGPRLDGAGPFALIR
ncbi:MAG: hypothetical protein M3486_05635, partial [Actinomycetota bacterium]|nr:hypothetical protein [Actinomycetota bacterium]